MSEFRNVLQKTIKILEKIGLDYVIVGGVAAITRGMARTTTDIDIILKNEPKLLNYFFGELKKEDFDVLDNQVKYALEENFNLSIFDNNSTLRLDIKIAKQKNDLNALKQSKIEDFNGIKIKIVPDELILWGKLQYLGDIEDLKDKDLLNFNDVLDFLSIYNLHKDEINMDWLIKQAENNNLENTLKTLLRLSKGYF